MDCDNDHLLLIKSFRLLNTHFYFPKNKYRNPDNRFDGQINGAIINRRVSFAEFMACSYLQIKRVHM